MYLTNTTDVERPLQLSSFPSPCPCCGHMSVPTSSTVGFDYWKGLVFRGDESVQLRPMEADLLKFLLDNWPEMVTRDGLLLGLYGGNYKDNIFSDKLGVFIARLRRKLEPFDIEILNSRSRGWWLARRSFGNLNI